MAKYTPPEYEKMFADFVAWSAGLSREGKLRGVERLNNEPGKVVRKRGDTIAVDGPYAEAKEVVVGLFVVEAKNIDEACAIAKGCPLVALGGTIEVRETGEFPKGH